VEEGLLVAIQHQLEQLNKTGIYTTSYHSEYETLAIDKNKIIFLYRMVQEVLNNVVKHSGAGHIRVDIVRKGEDVLISLQDNGKGFSSTHPGFRPGIGLSSIQQRALMISATVDVISTEGSGTVVNLVFKQNGYD
jgi:signal transduction histidine kinase